MKKKIITFKFLITTFAIIFCVFNSSFSLAFDENFFSSNSIYREREIKTSKINPEQKKIEKGFYFDINFETKIKNFVPANYADIIIRHLKKTAKEKFGGYSNYIDLIFKNYKIFYDSNGERKKYKIRFYIFTKRKETLMEIKKFVENNLLSKSYYSIFNISDLITETKYDEYKELYSSALLKRLKKTEIELAKQFLKKNYKKMNSIFSDFAQKITTTTNLVSTLVQDEKINKKAKIIQKTLDYIISNNLKNSKKYEDEEEYYYYYYDNEYDEYEDEFSDIKNKKNKIFVYLKDSIRKFFKSCYLNTDKLKEIKFSSFKNSLDNLSFNYKIVPVKRKIETYKGYVETISKI